MKATRCACCDAAQISDPHRAIVSVFFAGLMASVSGKSPFALLCEPHARLLRDRAVEAGTTLLEVAVRTSEA